jgi:hypothetical protein
LFISKEVNGWGADMSCNGGHQKARLMGGRTRARRKPLATLAMTGVFAIILAAAASSADIAGHVANDTGQPAAGVQVSVRDASGVAAGSVVSDAEGSYQIRGLKPGPYTLELKGQSVMSYVPREGLTVNWALSPTAQPLATAKVGALATDAKVSKSK